MTPVWIPGVIPAGHDRVAVALRRDPSWPITEDLVAHVEAEWFDGREWTGLCAFGMSGEPRERAPCSLVGRESRVTTPLPFLRDRARPVRFRCIPFYRGLKGALVLRSRFAQMRLPQREEPHSVAIDAATDSTSWTDTSGTVTWNHTFGSNVTGVAIEGGNVNSSTGSTSNTLTSISVDGTNTTSQIEKDSGTSIHTRAFIYGSAYASPLSAGSKAVVVTLVSTHQQGRAASITVTGGDTTTCFRSGSSLSSGGSAATSDSLSPTTGADEYAMDTVCYWPFGSGAQPITLTGGQTSIFNTTASGISITGAYLVGANPTMSESWPVSSANWSHCTAVFKVAAGGGGGFFARRYYDEHIAGVH